MVDERLARDRRRCDRARVARDALRRPGTPAWREAGATVSRGLRLIERGFLDDGKSVEALAAALGMTPRHLRPLFVRHFASIRRFNAAFRAVYRRPPSALRRARRATASSGRRRPHASHR
jgi:methylphosphotriester-DNA--protein-cysteine methyltransferase